MELLLTGFAVLLGSGMLSLVCSRSSRMANVIGGVGAAAGSVVAIIPAIRVIATGQTSELFTRPWQLPFASFSLQLDPLSAWFAAIILGLSAVAAIYGIEYMSHYGGKKNLGVSWLFYSLLVVTMTLVTAARNGVLFMLAWEGMALASYFLVVFEDEKPEVRDAGRVYLIASHLGVAFVTAFFVLLGEEAGTLDFSGIVAWSEAGGASAAVASGVASAMFLLAILGFGTKAGLMPLHVWLPEAHPVAPSHVSAVMSGVMIKCGIYGILRTLTFLGVGQEWWAWLLVIAGVASGLLGIMFALGQRDIKRFLAYSSVENIGIISLGIGIGMLGLRLDIPGAAILGFGGALLHVLNHALFKGLMFLSAGVVLHSTHTANMERLGGLLKKMPLLGGVVAVGAVAICGLPPLNGFVSEFLIYLAAFEEETFSSSTSTVLALVTIGGLAAIGGFAAAGFTRLFGLVFLGSPRSEVVEQAHKPSWLMHFPLVLLAGGCFAVVVFAAPLFQVIRPVIEAVSLQPEAVISTHMTEALGSLNHVVLIAGLLVGMVIALTVLRMSLLRGRDVGASPTWDCGYAAPAATMQYTASSYAQPIVDFHVGLLRTRTKQHRITQIFPTSSSQSSETPDIFMYGFYARVFQAVGWIAGRLAWIQHGRLSIYVLYIALALFSLLMWHLGSGELVSNTKM